MVRLDLIPVAAGRKVYVVTAQPLWRHEAKNLRQTRTNHSIQHGDSSGPWPKKQEMLQATNFDESAFNCGNPNVYYRNVKFAVQRAKTIQQKNRVVVSFVFKFCFFNLPPRAQRRFGLDLGMQREFSEASYPIMQETR